MSTPLRPRTSTAFFAQSVISFGVSLGITITGIGYRRWIRTGGPGIGLRPYRGRMTTLPRNWSTQPAGRMRGAGWPRRRRSWSVRRC